MTSKHKGAIKDGQPRDVGNIRHTSHGTMTSLKKTKNNNKELKYTEN